MASQVLSGNGPMSYTNNTGENVRVIINYYQWNEATGPTGTTNGIIISWGQGSALFQGSQTIHRGAIGRNLASQSHYYSATTSTFAATTQNAYSEKFYDSFGLPTEVMLAPGSTFSVSMQNTTTQVLAGYNIVVIPEGG